MRHLLLTSVFCALCTAQVRPSNAPDQAGANLPAYKIGDNDLLSVYVYDAPELCRTVRVSSDGHIRLPMLKSRIKVEGALPADVEAAIAQQLEKEEILVNPVVTVTVAEYSSRPITVAGAVKLPLTFQAIGPTRLLDALSKAGGLSEFAGNDIVVTHADDPSAEPVRIPVRNLMDGSDPALNIALTGGETIRIPEVGRIFVVGNVKKPGAFPLTTTGEATVLESVALAEGLMPFSTRQAYIYRRTADGSRKEILVELDQILRRKHSDVSVVADDILYIPDNKGRRLSVAALERVVLFGSTAGATALIYAGR